MDDFELVRALISMEVIDPCSPLNRRAIATLVDDDLRILPGSREDAVEDIVRAIEASDTEVTPFDVGAGPNIKSRISDAQFERDYVGTVLRCCLAQLNCKPKRPDQDPELDQEPEMSRSQMISDQIGHACSSHIVQLVFDAKYQYEACRALKAGILYVMGASDAVGIDKDFLVGGFVGALVNLCERGRDAIRADAPSLPEDASEPGGE